MAKNKNHASQNPPTPERLDLHQIPQALITPDIERRLAALEKSSNDITNRVLDGHKWFVTIIFSALVIVLGIYGIIFKSDVRDTIDQMEKRVDRSTSEMEKKVQALVGDALKKPLLVAVTDNGGPLSNSTNHISDRGFPQLYTVFLKNIGDKRTEPLSIRYSFEKGVEQNGGFNDWEQAPPNQKDFAVSFSSK